MPPLGRSLPNATRQPSSGDLDTRTPRARLLGSYGQDGALPFGYSPRAELDVVPGSASDAAPPPVPCARPESEANRVGPCAPGRVILPQAVPAVLAIAILVVRVRWDRCRQRRPFEIVHRT